MGAWRGGVHDFTAIRQAYLRLVTRYCLTCLCFDCAAFFQVGCRLLFVPGSKWKDHATSSHRTFSARPLRKKMRTCKVRTAILICLCSFCGECNKVGKGQTNERPSVTRTALFAQRGNVSLPMIFLPTTTFLSLESGDTAHMKRHVYMEIPAVPSTIGIDNRKIPLGE